MDNQKARAPEGRIQDLIRLTAQIRKDDGSDLASTVGTGFAVDRQRGLLVTCRHVVEATSEEPFCPGLPVWVYFDQVDDPDSRLQLARVYGGIFDHDDDVAVLQLEQPPLPDGVDVATLGDMAASVGREEFHDFRSYGFRRLDDYKGLPAWGRIIDFTAIPQDRNLQSRPIVLESSTIDRGMSGAPVLDMPRNLVVGVISETWESVGSATDRDTNFAVDAQVLTLSPLDLTLHPEYSLPYATDPPPSEEARRSAAEVSQDVFPLKPRFHPDQLPPPAGLVDRRDVLAELNRHWRDPGVHIAGLVGLAGEGKTRLAHQWLLSLLESSQPPRPDAVFWWDFQENRDIDAMIEAAMRYLYGDEATQRTTNTKTRVENIGAMITAEGRRILFVMDGVETVQYSEGDRFGRFKDDNLQRLLAHFAAAVHESFCIVTSRIQPPDLMKYTTYDPPDFSFAPYADAIADFVTSEYTTPPLTIGIFGEWGTGKSMMLKLIVDKIRERQEFHVAELSAWHVEDWSALIAQMLTELGKQERLPRKALKQAQRTVEKRHATTEEHMSQVRKCLQKLQSQLPHGYRIVVTIDDIDRCTPAKTMEILQTIHLILGDLDRTIVCLALDPSLVGRSIEKHYEAAFQEAGASGIEYLNKLVHVPFVMPRMSLEDIRFSGLEIVTEASDAADTVDPPLGEPLTSTSPDTELPREGRPPAALRTDEVAALKTVAQYVLSPRGIKRLLYTYRIVRSLLREPAESLDPKVVVGWLAVALGWPHAANAMLQRLDQMADNEAEAHGDALLLHLWQQCKPDYLAAGTADRNQESLERLLAEGGGWINRAGLERMVAVARNFLPYDGPSP